MITVEEACRLVLQQKVKFQIEQVGIEDALGRINAEPILADRDFPPFDRVTMDGIAIDYTQFANGKKIFDIESIAAAGAPQIKLADTKNAIEVMTGASLPLGVDTVIRYEDISIDGKRAALQIEQLRQGQNVHLKGKDRKRGDVLMEAGEVFNAGAIAIAATEGKSQVAVRSAGSVAVLTTGDELVEISQTPQPHQIRSSNSYMIQAVLRSMEIASHRYHVRDTQEDLEKTLQEIFAKHEIVIISGGVSKGKYDFVPDALEALGVKKEFHRVKQRPGKPFWFGTSESGKVVFALPGNPVSSYMCTLRYVKPFLRQSLGMKPDYSRQVILGEDYVFKPSLLYMLQVKLENTPGGFDIAHPYTGNGSGDFANLLRADGFLALDATEKSQFKKGEVHSFWPF